MDRVLSSLLVWSLLATFLLIPFVAAPTAARERQPASSDSVTRVEVRLTSEPLTLKESIRPEGTFMTFDSALPLTGNPGEPALPVIKQMIGVPSGDIPQPTVKLAAASPFAAIKHPLEPMPSLQLLATDGSVTAEAVGESYLADENLYARDEWYPANPVSISEVMTMRGQIVVAVSFTPLQVNLVTGEIRAFASADVSLAWATDSLPATIGFVEDPHHEAVLASALSNYEQARAWRKLPKRSHQAATSFGGDSWMIEVEGKGLFAMPFSQLQSAGVDTSNPKDLALYYGSGETAQEQALWIDNNNNTLYFINTREHNDWSKKIAYRLEVLTSGEGLRMKVSSSPPNQSSTVTSVPYELHFEEDKIYKSSISAAGATNRWYWHVLQVLSVLPTNSFTSTFDLPHVVTSHSSPATIDVELAPVVGNNSHYARVLINSVQYAEQGNPGNEWNGLSVFNQDVSVPHAELMASENQFEVEQQHLSGAPDSMYLNSFTVLYQRSLMVDEEGVFFNDSALSQGTNFELTDSSRSADEAGSSFLAFEVSTLGQPQRLTDVTMSGATLQFGRATPENEAYLVLLRNRAGQISAITEVSDSGLRSNLAQTDYLIITPPEFANVLQDSDSDSDFFEHRSQEYTVRLVTTTDIYNEFGAGVREPQAIRDFLKFAYQNWNAPAPAYVLLVGDTTYDAFDIEETGRGVWIPPWLVDKDPYKGEIPADQGYVAGLDASDEDNDPVADMYIGRLPANSEEEALALTQKIIDYETSSPLGEWRRSVFLVADDPDGAGDFHDVSDRSTEHFPTSGRVEVTKSYLLSDSVTVEIRDQIAEELNKGHLIIQYIGHSSVSQWADEGIWGVERDDGSDFDRLAPNRRLPLSLPWTCLDGYFIEPDEDSTSEQMLRLPDRGIIGAFAPTGLDTVAAHEVLTQKFYSELFDQESPQTQLGPLVSLSKLAALKDYERMMWTYSFLGDPAMRLNIPPCVYDETLVCEYNLYLPSIIR